MFYNVIRVLCKTTLILGITLFGAKSTLAQSTVSLADDIDSEIGVDGNLTDEISLFSEDDDFESGFLEPTQKIVTTTEENLGGNKTTTTTTTTTTSFSSEGNSPAGTVSLTEDEANMFDAYNNAPIVSSSANASPVVVVDDNFGEDILKQVDDKLFSQMSDIEKQTALLTLELRRERIKTEIEAIKIQRQKALEEEEAAREIKAREKAEWENAQQRLLIAEQVKLQEENIKLEKLRQEKIVNAYKNEMLKANQKWIESLSKAYNATKDIEAERAELLGDVKSKMSNLSSLAKKIGAEAVTAKENYEREIQNLQTQISILNSKVDTLNREKSEARVSGGVDNPFSPSFGSEAEEVTSLNDEYMILEIRGKGENVSAKLSNKLGEAAFFVKKGTMLRSGHIIEEITPTHVLADRNGIKETLYFSAGGVLEQEPNSDSKVNAMIGSGSMTPSSGSNSGSKRRPAVEENNVNVSDSFIEQMFAR